MGAIYVRFCDDREYGPGQSDYEYDRERQRRDDMKDESRVLDKRMAFGGAEPMSDIGAALFTQMAAITAGQQQALKIGRQQMARDVMGWVSQNAAHLGGAKVEGLIALCNRELKA